MAAAPGAGMKKIQGEEVRWGILGVGDVCEVKSAPAMNLVQGSRLVAVMRRNARLAEDYARRHGVPGWFSDADALFNSPEVNAIYIATPPDAHHDLSIRAFAAGKPVYVEKPMARTFAECQQMITASEATGLPLYVAYYRRTLPHFVRIRELLHAGAIGDVRHVRIELNQQLRPHVVRNLDNNWRVDPAVAGGGYFYDLASHQLDFLDFALGPIRAATGLVANQAGQYAAEDIVTAAFAFECGALGSGAWCFSTGPGSVRDQTTIVGSRGQIEYASFASGTGCFTLETDDASKQEFAFELPGHVQQFLIQAVVDALLGRGSCPSTGVSAARTNWVMEQICGAAGR